MKPEFIFVAILSFFLFSCNHSPKGAQESNNTIDSGYYEANTAYTDTIFAEHPFMSSAWRFFSDSVHADSFVVEIPRGNILDCVFQIRIYDHAGQLLFVDSGTTLNIGFDSADYDNPLRDSSFIVSMQYEVVEEVLDIDNFSRSGMDSLWQNEDGYVTNDSIALKEAINNKSTIIFTYYNLMGPTRICYSRKLKRVAVLMTTIGEDYD